MDFEIADTPEQSAFRAEVRAWLDTNIPEGISSSADIADHTYEEYLQLRELGRRLGARGWLYPTMPAEYGGGGLDLERSVVLHEELAERRLGLPPYYDSGGTMAAPTILVWGTEAQKQFLLPRICRGEVRTWQLLSEPEAGSDLAGVKMTAIRDGDDYVLNGTKLFIGSDHGADEMWTLAVTDPGGKRHENLGWFMVPGDTPGIKVVPMDLLGAAIPAGPGSSGDHHKNTIFFDDVRVPASRLVGGENNGWKVATTHLEVEHGGTGRPVPLPIVGQFFDYCRETPLDGLPMIDHPDLRETLAEIHSLSEINRLLGLRNFWLAHADRPRSYEGPQYSYLHRMNNLKIAKLMHEALGTVALTTDRQRGILEGEMELFIRAALIALHPAGTGDVQKLSVARRIGVGREEREAAGRLS
jgi:alkylation response protein AidB-like acyl-CoA dehydrogenase